ncbi:helix-turn-helix transcriptional regulator [Caballeronia sp. DA-9]|uniref:helix-turn-helix transcriptional regulator n=1 Tax=Caballeronia sp. DA-9 TaxID=3436237 RepID=UPI003F6695F1
MELKLTDRESPGASLKGWLRDNRIKKVDAARAIGIARTRLYEILNERARVTPRTARALEAWLSNSGPSAEQWMKAQVTFDLARARANEEAA